MMGFFLLLGAAGVALYVLGAQPVKQTDADKKPRQTPGVPAPRSTPGQTAERIAEGIIKNAKIPILIPIHIAGEWVNAVLDNWGGADAATILAGRERYRELARTISSPQQAGFPAAFYSEDPGMTLPRARQLLYFLAWHYWTAGAAPLFDRLSPDEQTAARAEGQYPGVEYVPGRGLSRETVIVSEVGPDGKPILVKRYA